MRKTLSSMHIHELVPDHERMLKALRTAGRQLSRDGSLKRTTGTRKSIFDERDAAHPRRSYKRQTGSESVSVKLDESVRGFQKF